MQTDFNFLFRYLDAYEKYYFLGEEEEDESNPYFDEEDGRARRERQRKIVQNVPTSYNEAQHRIAGMCQTVQQLPAGS